MGFNLTHNYTYRELREKLDKRRTIIKYIAGVSTFCKAYMNKQPKIITSNIPCWWIHCQLALIDDVSIGLLNIVDCLKIVIPHLNMWKSHNSLASNNVHLLVDSSFFCYLLYYCSNQGDLTCSQILRFGCNVGNLIGHLSCHIWWESLVKGKVIHFSTAKWMRNSASSNYRIAGKFCWCKRSYELSIRIFNIRTAQDSCDIESIAA